MNEIIEDIVIFCALLFMVAWTSNGFRGVFLLIGTPSPGNTRLDTYLKKPRKDTEAVENLFRFMPVALVRILADVSRIYLFFMGIYFFSGFTQSIVVKYF